MFRRKKANSDIRLQCLLMQKPGSTGEVIMVRLGVILSGRAAGRQRSLSTWWVISFIQEATNELVVHKGKTRKVVKYIILINLHNRHMSWLVMLASLPKRKCEPREDLPMTQNCAAQKGAETEREHLFPWVQEPRFPTRPSFSERSASTANSSFTLKTQGQHKHHKRRQF